MVMKKSVSLGQLSQYAIVMALCLCVIMQMLGVPMTLLSIGDSSDHFSGSILEGFAVPQMLSHLTLAPESIPVSEWPRSSPLPVLDSEQFHPPAH